MDNEVMGLVHVPSGEFWMGSDEFDKDAWNGEKTRHHLYLPEFWIGRYPVTNEEYHLFLLDNPLHQGPFTWTGVNYPAGKAQHPVTSVTWGDVVAYCLWLSRVTGRSYTLPSEAQWEKAARGTDGRRYPWGNQWDAGLCNSAENKHNDTTPVGAYSPRGDSPCGCADMAGNVWEWTSSLYRPYPYDSTDGREDPMAEGIRVLRGGAFDDGARRVRCAYRLGSSPDDWGFDGGFRVVLSP